MVNKTNRKLIDLLYNPGSLNTVFDGEPKHSSHQTDDFLPPALSRIWLALEASHARPENVVENLMSLRSLLNDHPSVSGSLPKLMRLITRLAASYPHSTDIFSQALGLISDYKQRADAKTNNTLTPKEWVELERCLHTLCNWEEQLDQFLELSH